jgi:hypothetical protein
MIKPLMLVMLSSPEWSACTWLMELRESQWLQSAHCDFREMNWGKQILFSVIL